MLLATKDGRAPFSQELTFANEGDEPRIRIELAPPWPSYPTQLGTGEPITPPAPLVPLRPEFPLAERRPEGKVAAKCVVTVEGVLADCRIVQSLSPAFDHALLDGITKVHMTPAVYQGKAVSLFYTFTFNFKAP